MKQLPQNTPIGKTGKLTFALNDLGCLGGV